MMSSDGQEAHARTRTLVVEADGCEIPVRIVWPSKKPGPAIVILHEKRGMDDHTVEIAQRLAKAGYTAILPDLLARIGGSGQRTVVGSAGSRGIPSTWLIDDLMLTVDSMLDMINADRFGVIGYSFGGVLAWQLAGREARCRALIDYHGRPPHDLEADLTDVSTLVIFASLDDEDKIVATRRLLANSRIRHIEVFEGQRRGFEDPSRPDRFDAVAAERAWKVTLGWLKGHLPPDQAT